MESNQRSASNQTPNPSNNEQRASFTPPSYPPTQIHSSSPSADQSPHLRQQSATQAEFVNIPFSDSPNPSQTTFPRPLTLDPNAPSTRPGPSHSRSHSRQSSYGGQAGGYPLVDMSNNASTSQTQLNQPPYRFPQPQDPQTYSNPNLVGSTDKFSTFSSTGTAVGEQGTGSGMHTPKGSISMKPTTPSGSHSRTHSTHFLLAHGRGHVEPPTLDETGNEVHEGPGRHPARHASEYESTEHQMRGRMFLGGLFKPFVVRQFLHNGFLYREEEERGISHFELFADLVFVAIVHILGEVAAEKASIGNAVKFFLMFWPPWSIWADMRSYLNVSGTDDFVQRAYILISSLLLMGYTAQGASIELHTEEAGSFQEESTPSHKHSVKKVLSKLVGRSALEDMTISNDGYAALRAATAFFLVAKAIRILLLLAYAITLPRFRTAHLVQVVFTLIPCLIFLRMFWVNDVVGAMEVFVIGFGLDLIGKYVAGIVVHSGSSRKNRHKFFIPALEIGHVIEKTTAFFVLVAGEILIAVSFVTKDSKEIGPHGEYARSCLGVTLAFLLCWIYFDADSCKVFVHAIRRHWFSSITWTQLHLPLCAGLVIVAAAAHEMIIEEHISQGLRYYFGIGMAIILLSLGAMGFLHRSLDKPFGRQGGGLIPRWIRLSLRLGLGAVFAVLPAVIHNESSVFELGIACVALAGLVIVETVGKIGLEGNVAPELDLSGGPAVLDASEIRQPTQPDPRDEEDEPEGHSTGVEYISGHKRFRRDDLTAYEKGEEDVGGENSVGLMKAVAIRRGQRTGLAAF